MSTDDIVIVAAARTPQGRLKGQLASFTAPQLGGFAIAGALAQGGIPADAVSRADPTEGAGESADDDPRGPDVADTGRGGAGAP